MALVGYQSQLEKLSAKVAEIKLQLGQSASRLLAAVTATDHTGAKRAPLSAAARARIAAAQRARWAAYRKGQAAPAKAAPQKPKRRLSAAGRRAIIAATKKRWAAVRAAKSAV